jgi:peroxiredoxin
LRSWRLSALIETGEAPALFAEPGSSGNCRTDLFDVSDAMLAHVRGRKTAKPA